MFAFDPYNFISTLVICFAIQIGFLSWLPLSKLTK